jgi:hypothetical protein
VPQIQRVAAGYAQQIKNQKEYRQLKSTYNTEMNAKEAADAAAMAEQDAIQHEIDIIAARELLDKMLSNNSDLVKPIKNKINVN